MRAHIHTLEASRLETERAGRNAREAIKVSIDELRLAVFPLRASKLQQTNKDSQPHSHSLPLSLSHSLPLQAPFWRPEERVDAKRCSGALMARF